MAYTTFLPRRDASRLTRREPTVQLRTDPELRIGPPFKLPEWLLLASWCFGGLFSSFPTVLHVSSEARTKEILCKPMEEQSPRLTAGLSPVYQRDEKRSSFLAADQCTDAYLSL